MLIPWGDEIRIRDTAECWQLEMAVKRKGEREWKVFKYFKSLSDAVGEACGCAIRLHPATGLKDAIEAVDQIAANYARVFDEALDDVESRRAA